MTALFVLTGLAIAGGIAVVVVDKLIRRPGLAVVMTIGAFVADAAVEGSLAAVRAGSAKITVTDAAFGLVAVAGMARHLRLRRESAPHLALFLIGGLAALSLVRGLPLYGESAVNEFRTYLYFCGSAVYFSSIPYTDATRQLVGRLWLGGALAMAGVVFVRWGARLAGVSLGAFDDEFNHAIRVLSGTDSYLFGEALLITLPAWSGPARVRHQRLLAFVFAVISLALNRRTMWLAILAGLAVLVARNRRWAPRVRGLFAAVAVLAVLASVVLPDEAPEGQTGVAQSATSTGTLEWRVEGWKGFLETGPESAAHWSVGVPFGAGFERERGNEIAVVRNPHSFYVETLLRLGIIGLGVLISLYAMVASGLLRRRRSEGDAELLSSEVLLALLVAHVVWCIAWPPGAAQGVLIGVAISAAAPAFHARRGTRRDQVPSSARPERLSAG